MNTIIKISWPQPGDSTFVAFPWDVHLLATYETIFKSLKEQKEYKNLTFKYGFKVLPSEKKSLGIAEFINRNKQMYDIFVEGIENSDIFIADITDRNPNVMLELGIAMKLNKNILILKEKGKKEKFPFNIQSVHIQEYGSIAELEKIISDFIDIYSRIRNQTFNAHLQERYIKIDKIDLVNPRNFISHPKFPKGVKNLKMRFKYTFPDHVHPADWVGIHLRTLGPERNNSELIYSRVNGELESLSWPPHKAKIEGAGIKTRKNNIFEISIIENKLEAWTSTKQLIDENVFIDSFGDILIGSWNHPKYPSALKDHQLRVECTEIEIINLDTTSSI